MKNSLDPILCRMQFHFFNFHLIAQKIFFSWWKLNFCRWGKKERKIVIIDFFLRNQKIKFTFNPPRCFYQKLDFANNLVSPSEMKFSDFSCIFFSVLSHTNIYFKLENLRFENSSRKKISILISRNFFFLHSQVFSEISFFFISKQEATRKLKRKRISHIHRLHTLAGFVCASFFCQLLHMSFPSTKEL